MTEFLISLLNSTSGASVPLSTITLGAVFHINNKLKKHFQRDKEHAASNEIYNVAMKMQMKNILQQLHEKCKVKRYVTDIDWEIWVETYDVYTKLGGNGVAKAWNADMIRWRSK